MGRLALTDWERPAHENFRLSQPNFEASKAFCDMTCKPKLFRAKFELRKAGDMGPARLLLIFLSVILIFNIFQMMFKIFISSKWNLMNPFWLIQLVNNLLGQVEPTPNLLG